MSLSQCLKCGGHIPLGAKATNVCADCGAHVFAVVPAIVHSHTISNLLAAAQAVVTRWDTPLHIDIPPTAIYINELRRAIEKVGE